MYKILRSLDGSRRLLLGERSTEFAQQVVIKFVAPEGSDSVLEASILGRLQHENIVQLLGTGVSDSGEYLVLEYVDGQPIDVFCRENELSLDSRLHLLDQIMGAVAYAHRRLVIHADLKPANILGGSG